MTYAAWTFVLALQSGEHVALGLLSSDARFIGLLPYASDTRAVEHRQVNPADWSELANELSLGIGPAPLAHTSAIHHALAGDAAGVTVRYLSQQLIALAQPDEVVWVLDRFLARQVEAYGAL